MIQWVADTTHTVVCDVGSNPVIATFVLLSTPNRSVSQHEVETSHVYTCIQLERSSFNPFWNRISSFILNLVCKTDRVPSKRVYVEAYQ